MSRFPIASLIVAMLIGAHGEAAAQSVEPAPPLGQAGLTQWPPVTGNSPVVISPRDAFSSGGRPQPPGVPDECVNGYARLRADLQKKANLLRAARNSRAPFDLACRLIGDYQLAEANIIKFVKINAARCGIPTQTADQLTGGHERTEAVQKQVCTLAQRYQKEPPAGPSGDFYPAGLHDTPENRPVRGRSADFYPGNVVDKPTVNTLTPATSSPIR